MRVQHENRAAVRRTHQRGMALLLVMIGMVVCTILTAGFLASQGTSLGIARNERDAQKCRVMAQTGVDMCYWLIRNRADWRGNMNPGKWLDSFPVGDGTVTVTVQDGDNTGSFLDDPTQGVVMTSTGTYDSREFALTATVRPTGGGTVFNSGNFVGGKIVLGNTDLVTVAQLDSYNSSVAAYSSLTAGSNAAFTTTSTGNSALTVYSPSSFRGSFTSNPNVVATSLITLVGGSASGPVATGSAVEVRSPGSVITPNTTGLTYRGPGSYGSNISISPGRYDALSIIGGTVSLGNGLYYVTGNLTIANAFSGINVPAGKAATLMVDGNASFSGPLSITGSGSLAIFCNGNITVSGVAVNGSGPPSRLVIYGTNNCGAINITGGAQVYAAVFAPTAIVTLQSGTAKFYGGIIASSVNIKSTAQFHFDEALKSLRLSNITGGSAPSGTPDYRVTVSSGPGLVR